MKDIIIAYPDKAIALKLKSFLESEGYSVSHVCALASSVLGIARTKKEGVIVCASFLKDMSAPALAEHLPPDFDVLSLSRSGRAEYNANLITLPLPLNREVFLQTVAVAVSSKSSLRSYNEKGTDTLNKAKLVLKNTKELTEFEAHRYLQKESMRTGIKIEDIAKRIISDFT